jgi:ABC-type arginine transport system permease subunit
MKDTLSTIKGLVGGVTTVLLSVLGLLVVAQVVFGETASINVIGNLQSVVNGFVGEGASLAGVITLLLVVALLQKGGKQE